MLDTYVDNLRIKNIDKRDLKLLKITGLEELLNILKAKEIYHKEIKRRDVNDHLKYTDGVNIEDL